MPTPPDDHDRLVAFAREVKELRRLTIEVLKRKNYGLLDQVKEQEKRIDRMVKDILQPTLFGDH